MYSAGYLYGLWNSSNLTREGYRPQVMCIQVMGYGLYLHRLCVMGYTLSVICIGLFE